MNMILMQRPLFGVAAGFLLVADALAVSGVIDFSLATGAGTGDHCPICAATSHP